MNALSEHINLNVYENKKINWPIVQTFVCSHKSTDALQTLIRPQLGVCLPSVESLSEKRNRTTRESTAICSTDVHETVGC